LGTNKTGFAIFGQLQNFILILQICSRAKLANRFRNKKENGPQPAQRPVRLGPAVRPPGGRARAGAAARAANAQCAAQRNATVALQDARPAGPGGTQPPAQQRSERGGAAQVGDHRPPSAAGGPIAAIAPDGSRRGKYAKRPLR